ncbi:cytidylate kinase [Paenibacillus phyllosphaerae]|uniref:Cytidylate kinase n=1 Tax=Paenibacillus phyllosphaerae TaxID=274593 RepID=A0A7W5FPY0_9BACL|nr:AAA family ATPase [Paenibacillus phyllosphaerae]MBB3112708.1 cytidylate kinase [Paenibacillus phyllosphaerae]
MTFDKNSVNVYLISGPLGVGKSTVSKNLAGAMKQGVLIEGDLLLHVYRGETEPPWEERLRLAWLNITAVTRNFVLNGLDVVIDFVVEDELEWFSEQLSDLEVVLRYVVLYAEPDTLANRLHQRGDAQYLHRSLFLRNKLMASSTNEPYLLDTENRKPDELAETILTNSKFRLQGSMHE